MEPREVVERYVAAAVADGKEALAELFAPEATFEAPDGRTYRGRAEIAAFYGRHLASITPSFFIARIIEDGPSCWVELANGSAHSPLFVASNHFLIGADGQIEHLRVFLRPQAPTPDAT
jgi:limonene-1,2-epoxide hydrolase